MRMLTIPLFIASFYWLRARLNRIGQPELAVAASWFALGPFLALTMVEAVRLAIAIPVAAVFYLCSFIARPEQNRQAPMYFSVAATMLLAAILYESVSGSLLTVCWGAEGLVLLAACFALRDRVFRLQGLGLLLACTLKLFPYDLRNLETPYRIVSFIVLGLILLGVSWIYSRFREQVRRIL
jgi:uncharacterized membrane protein